VLLLLLQLLPQAYSAYITYIYTLHLCAQIASAVFRPHAPAASSSSSGNSSSSSTTVQPSAARVRWALCHRTVGWCLLVAAALQLAGGLGIEHSAAATSAPLLLLACVAGALWLAEKRRRSKQRYWGIGSDSVAQGVEDAFDSSEYDAEQRRPSGTEMVFLYGDGVQQRDAL
jgi:hypothetical protein